MAQYLGSKELLSLISVSDVDFEGFKPVSTDSYSDVEVYNSIKKLNALKPLCLCAIQTAVIGYGNKTYGEFSLKGEKVDVRSLYKEYGVKDDLTQNAKLNPGDLTPRRLQRFYRANIHKYLENNAAMEPYLWKKYSTHDVNYRSITFPGAESLIDNDQEAEYLLETYKCLDERLSTNIHERVKRVLVARKILS
ncbi:hypothetical protein KVV02_003032 [Mortierella alpina]|uniref:Uncharacterized protein n=1 Tax=Mortierella alpina TaxID=64518 RepID=A0A9P7ZX39_MORAP|nr:hypothetical protein KVV02_003032 [Mortierella alpina]